MSYQVGQQDALIKTFELCKRAVCLISEKRVQSRFFTTTVSSNTTSISILTLRVLGDPVPSACGNASFRGALNTRVGHSLDYWDPVNNCLYTCYQQSTIVPMLELRVREGSSEAEKELHWDLFQSIPNKRSTKVVMIASYFEGQVGCLEKTKCCFSCSHRQRQLSNSSALSFYGASMANECYGDRL